MTMMLKIGFIQAKNEIDINWFRPLAFGYLKAYLDKYLNVPFEMKYLENSEGFEKYDIVGISSASQDFHIAQEIARTVKQNNKNVVTILGGHHITYLPQTLPRQIDIGVIGEGEQTFLELVRLFLNRSTTANQELMKINGIVFHEGGRLIITPPRKRITPLDNIPVPHRSDSESTYLFTSRGCPYRCAFCSSSAFWETTRFFSAEYVVDEIALLINRFPALKHIAICDDLFIANLPRLRQIVVMMEKKGLCEKVTFSSSVRSNLVNDELCELLKRMNIVAVGIGIESGSNRILAVLNKGITVKINQRAIDILYNHGIEVRGSLIVGCPTEVEKEVRSTYEFALKNIRAKKMSPQCAVNILSPMPGTKIWDDYVTLNVRDIKAVDWPKLSIFASYRNSNISDIDEWIQCRRHNQSIYLAENTLPQERLYSLMSGYEKAIKDLEMVDISADVSNPERPAVKKTGKKLSCFMSRFFKKSDVTDEG